MSKLEDDISRAMAGHDDEAPRPADLLRALEQASAPRRHPGWYVPFMVAAAVAAVVAGSVWAGGLLGGHKPTRLSGGAIPVQRLLSCPASYAHQAPWVPAKPAGIDGRSRLPVPCLNGYRTLPQHRHRLSRSRRSRDVLRRDAGLEGRNLLRLG